MTTLNEVKLLQNMKHPHIIKTYHSFIDDSYLYILMEYAAGGDLYKFVQMNITERTGVIQNKLWKWAYEILLAIRYLHDNCIIHWDLKASNIFITKKNRIKIGDFGSSKILNPVKMYIKEEVGTKVYLSPEQVNHVGLYDYKIDIWAFGCLLYYLAAYKPPFAGTNFADLSYNIMNSDPDKLPQAWSKEYQIWIQKALAKSSKERPTAIELCLQIPATIIHNYTPPIIPTLGSMTFWNPTQSAIGKQKFISKKIEQIETLKVKKAKKSKPKLKTSNKVKFESIYNDPYSSNYKSFTKPSLFTKK